MLTCSGFLPGAMIKFYFQKKFFGGEKGFISLYNFRSQSIIKGSQGRNSLQDPGAMLLVNVSLDHSRVHASLTFLYSQNNLPRACASELDKGTPKHY